MENKGTPFSEVFDLFFSLITDDMFLELDKGETEELCGDLLVAAIPSFEFPQIPLDFTVTKTRVVEKPKISVVNDETQVTYEKEETAGLGYFHSSLSLEEKRILATYMVVQWLGQQLASVELTRMKYAGSDFKLTSQANHMAKLLQLKKEYVSEGFHLQRLYSRRKVNEDGIYVPTWDNLRTQ